MHLLIYTIEGMAQVFWFAGIFFPKQWQPGLFQFVLVDFSSFNAPVYNQSNYLVGKLVAIQEDDHQWPIPLTHVSSLKYRGTSNVIA